MYSGIAGIAAGATLLIGSVILSQGHGSSVQPAQQAGSSARSFVVFRDDDGQIKVVNQSSGSIEYSSADPATVIQKAMDGLASGARILLQAGTYELSKTLVLATPNVMLIGEENSVLKAAARNMDILSISSAANSTYVQGIGFYGDGYGTGRGIAIQSDGTSIVNCSFENIPHRMIEVRGNDTLVFGSVFQGDPTTNENYGVNMSGMKGLKVIGSHFHNCYCAAYVNANSIVQGNEIEVTRPDSASFGEGQIQVANTSSFVVVSNNAIKQNGYRGNAIDLNTTTLSTVENNIIDSPGNDGIATDYSSHLTISTNRILNARRLGMSLYCAHDNMVTENTILDSGQGRLGWECGIYIDQPSALRNQILNNSITDDQTVKTQQYGVRDLNGADYNTITGNYLRGNAIAGLLCQGPHDVAAPNTT